MEYNKSDNSQGRHDEKFIWYKYHHVIIPLVIVFLFIVVFMAGLAIGREFAGDRGEGGNRGGWQENNCGGKGFFRSQADCGDNYADRQAGEEAGEPAGYAQEKNLNTNVGTEAENTANTGQAESATSTVNR